jgi:hypothetical protein
VTCRTSRGLRPRVATLSMRQPVILASHLLGASFVGPGVAELWHTRFPAFPRSPKSGCGYWKLTATPWTPRPLASLVDERLPALGAAQGVSWVASSTRSDAMKVGWGTP